MLRSILKISIRNFRNNAGYTFINLLGLVIGFTSVILIGIYIQNELSYDQYHPKKNELYRLAAKIDGASYNNGVAKVTYNWGQTALEDIPEVINRCRFLFFGRTLVKKENLVNYESGGLFADAAVFDMFNWRLIEGNPEEALKAPNSLVLTQTLAEKYFPSQNPVGKTLNFDNEIDYTITGVVEDVPLNSHFTFNFLVSMSSYTHRDLLDWVRWNQFYTYVETPKGIAPELIATKMDAVLDKHLTPEGAEATFPLVQPLTSIHLHSNLHREMTPNSNITYIYIFSVIAVFLLIIACLNFINLSTAKASDRAKEIGVKKVMGASKNLLIQQFLGESILLCATATIISIFLAEFCLPFLNAFMGGSLVFGLVDNGPLLLVILAITLFSGLLAGAYPSLILADFRPVKVLKGHFSFSQNALLKKGLVVFQFALAAFLIIASLTAINQLEYIQNKNLGFDKEQIVVVNMQTPEARNKAQVIKEELAKIPGVLNVSTSANRPGGTDYGVPYQAAGLTREEMPAMRCLVIDDKFLKTYGMEMASGRGFSSDFATDSIAYLINETAAKQLGWENPLANKLSMPAVGRPEGPIIGVVKDFHFRSMHEKIAPLYFFVEPSWYSQFSIKLTAEDINNTLATIEQKWKAFEPNHPFTFQFFDQQFDALHQAEAATAQLIKGFTFLAILVTCLGLFALSTYAAVRRRKEMGIRKVLGASVINIVGTLSKEFVSLVLLSFLVAIPLGWYFSDQWLQNFAYRIKLGWWTFAMAIILSVVIAFLSVSYQSFKVAIANPIKSLRTE